ncbi:MAG TPA: ABC-2 family transporter protein [Phycisphaerae bacterium]|nr:ABC-2 family transporter protein [Phycisphaerae bacterium]
MIRAIKLILLFARVSVQNIAAYRFEMIMRSIMSVLHLGAELVGVWTIFKNTQSLQGWGVPHMLVLVGVYRIIAGGIRMSIVPNMRRVFDDIRDGTLDFVLLKPVNSQFLVSIREFIVWRIADVILGAAVAVVGCVMLLGRVPPGPAAVFVVMLAAGFAIVYAVWLILATLCFWFVRIQNIEMIFWNVFEAGRFPIVIYRPWVQWVLTFIVPLAFITTFPAGVLFGDSTMVPRATPLLAVLVAVVLLVISNRFWRFGLRHYSGASG